MTKNNKMHKNLKEYKTNLLKNNKKKKTRLKKPLRKIKNHQKKLKKSTVNPIKYKKIQFQRKNLKN